MAVVGGVASGGSAVVVGCSSSSVTSAVAVGGTRACAEEADDPGVSVGTGGGRAVGCKITEAVINRFVTSAPYLFQFLALGLGQIARQQL